MLVARKRSRAARTLLRREPERRGRAARRLLDIPRYPEPA
jgi:hypothetical protein